jgi:drug/metabolite transporter (DMT)-like permease
VKSIALVGLLALLWGSSFPLLKVAAETIPPLSIAAMRSAGAGVMLAALLGRELAQVWQVARAGPGVWIQAFFSCIAPWILIAWAASRIDASLMAILNSLSPIFIFLMTWGITRHEVATPLKFAGVALGLAGVVAIIGPDALRGLGANTMAELACVAGSLAYAVGGIIGTRYHKVSPLVPAAGSIIIAAVVLVPIAAVAETWTSMPSARSLWAAAALCIFSTGLAMVVYFRLLATVGSIATSAQAYLRIFVGVGAGVLLLDEKLTASMVVGLLLVVAGVVAMTWPRKLGPGPERQ